MLQAMLLAGIVATPLGCAALFLPMRRHARRARQQHWILDHPVTAWRKSHRAKLSTGSALDSGTACDDQRTVRVSPLRRHRRIALSLRELACPGSRPVRRAGAAHRRRRARPCRRDAATGPAPALRAQLPDALRRARPDQVVWGAGHLPVVLLQLRPARQLPRYRHRLPARPGPGQPVPLCPGGPGPADPVRPSVPGRGRQDRERGDHLLRLREVQCQRAAHLGHAARRVPGCRRRHGDDRRRRRPDVHHVPCAGRLPARHRRQHHGHRGLLGALVPRRQAGRLGAHRGPGPAPALWHPGRPAPGRRGRRRGAAALVGIAVVQRHLVALLPHLGAGRRPRPVLHQRQRHPAPEHHPSAPAPEGLLPAVPGRSRQSARQRTDRRRGHRRRRGERPPARREAHRRR